MAEHLSLCSDGEPICGQRAGTAQVEQVCNLLQQLYGIAAGFFLESERFAQMNSAKAGICAHCLREVRFLLKARHGGGRH